MSAFAGNPLLISPEFLQRQGLLTKGDTQNVSAPTGTRVDYRFAGSYKAKLLNTAFERFRNMPTEAGYERFCSENKGWLEDYAMFIALSEHLGCRLWSEWPAGLRDRKRYTLKSMSVQLQKAIDREKFLQYEFFRQWFDLKRYCNERGIEIIGDIPFYVAYDGAEVWANQEIFKLTKTRKPRVVSGVPPDCFSQTGQLWGNPVYDWQLLKKKGYGWWFERIRHNIGLFDIVRIDHFTGFISYWQVPAGNKTAVKGKWVSGPKDDFFRKLFKRFPFCRLVVEDLGRTTAAVSKVIEEFRLPCMKVLLYAFDSDLAANSHCPYNHVENCVVYTGTHDNNTVRGWFENEAKSKQKQLLFDYLGRKVAADEIHWELIRLAMSSVANTAIIPMQDVLGLVAEARMNRPGSVRGNWSWRFCWSDVSRVVTAKLAKVTRVYGRACMGKD